MITAATAPCAWGVWYANDPGQVPWERYLDEVVAAGFAFTEAGPWGYLPTDPARLQDELSKRSLAVCGAALVHPLSDPDGFATFAEQIDNTCAQLKAVDAKWVVVMDDDVPGGRTAGGLDRDRWRSLIDNTIEAARRVTDSHGLRFVFHPHVGTGVETEEEVERFLAETPAGLVDLCFDFGHHAYTGADPVAFMKRHFDRMPYLHFKNIDPAVMKTIEAEGIDYITGFGMGAMCELDRGSVDFGHVVEWLRQNDYDGFAVHEQDMHPCPPDKPLPIAVHNRAVMRSLGI